MAAMRRCHFRIVRNLALDKLRRQCRDNRLSPPWWPAQPSLHKAMIPLNQAACWQSIWMQGSAGEATVTRRIALVAVVAGSIGSGSVSIALMTLAMAGVQKDGQDRQDR
ncbi:MAG: hypothetical protein ACR2PC_14570 [Tsuneonella suprasediminis]